MSDEPEIVTLIDEHRYVCMACGFRSQPFSGRMSKKKMKARNEIYFHVENEHTLNYLNTFEKIKIVYFQEYEYVGVKHSNDYPDSIPEPLVVFALKRALNTSYNLTEVPAYFVSSQLLHYFKLVWGSPDNPHDKGVWGGHDKVINALNRLSNRGIIERRVVDVNSAYSHVISKQRALGEVPQAQGVGYAWKTKIAHFTLKGWEGRQS